MIWNILCAPWTIICYLLHSYLEGVRGLFRWITEDSQRTVSATAEQNLRESIFLFTVGEDERGIGVFIGPKLAVTAHHNITSDNDPTTIYANVPALGKEWKLTVGRHDADLDYLLLSSTGRHPYLRVWRGDPEQLVGGEQLGLCDYMLGVKDELGPRFVRGLAIRPAHGISLSEDKATLLFTAVSWPGDSGGALVTHGGELVGLHVGGVGYMRGLPAARARSLNERLSELEGNVVDAIKSVASCCEATLADTFYLG